MFLILAVIFITLHVAIAISRTPSRACRNFSPFGPSPTGGEPTTCDFLSHLFGLEGKTAIVTGATGGIGGAVAEALYRSGANVVIHGRTDEKTEGCVSQLYEKYSRSSGLLPVSADLTSKFDTTTLLDKTIDTFGGVDIIVNNAGMNLDEHLFEDSTQEDWERISNINMGASIALTRNALPLLKQSCGGRIINICSIGAHVGLPNNVLYTMTKGGMLLFTKSLAAELAQDTRVTVNSISPGVIATPMNAKYAPGTTDHDSIVKQIPMKRMGNPMDLVGAVVYLASDAGGYTTGTDIVVDGGFAST